MRNNYKLLSLLLLCIGAMSWSCNKDKTTPDPAQDPDYQRRIRFVMQDNLNFTITTAAMQFGGILDSTTQPGPFTFCAPVDAAWAPFNIASTNQYSFQSFTSQRMHEWMMYHLLKGSTDLRKLPLDTDTALLAMNGGHVYVKTYLENGDTVITINGLKILSVDIAASNGNIQSIPYVLNPDSYNTMMDQLGSIPYLTLFVAALQHSGLDSLYLTGSTPYTVLAPSNAAFIASAGTTPGMDLTTISGILATDPATLAEFLKCHIIKGRFFQTDLYRAAAANGGTIAAVNDEAITISGSPQSFNSIQFRSPGGSFASIYRLIPTDLSQVYTDIPAHNGVLFIINTLLIP